MNEYEVFKLKWLADHGFTLKDAFIAAVNYSKENVSLLLGDPEQSFDIWESERGFEGMIYPCEREWQDEWDDLDEPPQCIDCRFFMIKNKCDRLCGNPSSPEYGHYVDDYDRNDCFVPVDCNLSVSQLPKCEDCEHQCPDHIVYEALTAYCSGKIEQAENSEYRFKCCTADTDYVTETDCQKCEKNGCHMCSAARDAEKLLTWECNADELVFESDNTLGDYLKRLK